MSLFILDQFQKYNLQEKKKNNSFREKSFCKGWFRIKVLVETFYKCFYSNVSLALEYHIDCEWSRTLNRPVTNIQCLSVNIKKQNILIW